MDAEYYYAGGYRLAQGYGFSELFLWNYLDNPEGLPHPSHAYWMPLASILTALGIKLTGIENFFGGRVLFIFLAAWIPPLTASLSYSLVGSRRAALLAGLFSVFPAFYLPFLPTTDTFGLYMLFGLLFLTIVHRVYPDQRSQSNPVIDRKYYLGSFALGLLVGLMHLARADGLLWLLIAVLIIVSFSGPRRPAAYRGSLLLLAVLGYLLVMGPWIGRNLFVFGTFLSPGGLSTLWARSYDELFIYPPDILSPAHYLSDGLTHGLQARWWALGQNLQTALGVQGEIFLTPLILLGLWRLRRFSAIQVGVGAWVLTFFAMSLIFPFAGARGGFFHSGAALQPLFFAVVPAGLETFVEWGRRVRRWRASQARTVFSFASIFLAVALTVVLTREKLVDVHSGMLRWESSNRHYEQIERMLQEAGAGQEEIVLVNNAPGYFVATGRPAISIPYGTIDTLFAVARRYNARYLVLEIPQIQGAEGIYTRPGHRPGLKFFRSVGSTQIYRIEQP